MAEQLLHSAVQKQKQQLRNDPLRDNHCSTADPGPEKELGKAPNTAVYSTRTVPLQYRLVSPVCVCVCGVVENMTGHTPKMVVEVLLLYFQCSLVEYGRNCEDSKETLKCVVFGI